MVKVLFVCMGNICRSPGGEGVFQHYVDEQGYADLIRVASAGTTAYHSGAPADHRMREAAGRRGYTLASIARQVRRADIDAFDLIVAMDHDNLAELQRLANGVKPHITLLGSFIDPAQPEPVPDPYYGGAEGFEKVLDMIETACPGMFAHCKALLEAPGHD